jgi:hypothetical protein
MFIRRRRHSVAALDFLNSLNLSASWIEQGARLAHSTLGFASLFILSELLSLRHIRHVHSSQTTSSSSFRLGSFNRVHIERQGAKLGVCTPLPPMPLSPCFSPRTVWSIFHTHHVHTSQTASFCNLRLLSACSWIRAGNEAGG